MDIRILSWDAVSTTYLVAFLAVLAGLIAAFVGASKWMAWNRRRKEEKMIQGIEERSGLTSEEADFVVHVSNKNQLNVPSTLYTTLRIYDTLIGKELELLLDSVAPWSEKTRIMELAYGSRAKLFPATREITMPALLQSVEPARSPGSPSEAL